MVSPALSTFGRSPAASLRNAKAHIPMIATMNAYVGIAKNVPDSRIPRRFIAIRATTSTVARTTSWPSRAGIAPATAASLATERFPVGGSGDTVHRATYRTSDFRVTSGASYRHVIDVGDWDKSLWINVPGQSADPKSPFYKNLIDAWAKGEFQQMAFSRGAVDAKRADTLNLLPKP